MPHGLVEIQAHEERIATDPVPDLLDGVGRGTERAILVLGRNQRDSKLSGHDGSPMMHGLLSVCWNGGPVNTVNRIGSAPAGEPIVR